MNSTYKIHFLHEVMPIALEIPVWPISQGISAKIYYRSVTILLLLLVDYFYTTIFQQRMTTNLPLKNRSAILATSNNDQLSKGWAEWSRSYVLSHPNEYEKNNHCIRPLCLFRCHTIVRPYHDESSSESRTSDVPEDALCGWPSMTAHAS